MPRKFACAAFLVLAAVASGCTTYGPIQPMRANYQEIVLKENDFKTVKSHVTGSAECFYIINIPMGDVEVVSKSEAQIRQKAALDGRPYQLVNWTKDDVVTSYFGIAKNHAVTLTADVIEFTK